MKKTVYAFILLIIGFNGNAQNQSHDKRRQTIDSLFIVLKTIKAETTRVNAYAGLCLHFNSLNFDTALYFGNQGLKIALQKNYKKGIANSNMNIGFIHKEKRLFDKAFLYYFKALKSFEEAGDKKGLSKCYSNIGNIYYDQGNFDKALECNFISLKIDQELGDKKGLAGCFGNISAIYEEQGIFDKALEYNLKALKIYDELGDKNWITHCYINFGNIYFGQRSFDKALEYSFKALKNFEEAGDKDGISRCYIIISAVHNSKQNYDKALDYSLRALKINEDLKDLKEIANSYNCIAGVYYSKQLFDLCIYYSLKAIKINKEIGNKNGMAILYGNIAALNIVLADSATLSENKRNNYLNKSIEYGMNALELANEINAMPWENSAANNLMIAYKKLGNFKKSVEYAEIFIATKDSMFREEKTRAIAEMMTKYETEKKDIQIQIQKTAIENKNITIKRTVLSVIVISFLLLLTAFYYLKTRKAYLKLVKQNFDIAKKENELKQASLNNLRVLPDNILSIQQQLLFLMETENVYKEAGLNLEKLAEKLSTNRTYLSQLINEKFQTNFTGFINEYRIKEARLILSDTQNNIPIKQLYEQLGFASKATFYEAFKKFTGISPSFYRKNLKKQI